MPMLKPVGMRIWSSIPKSGRNKITSATSAASFVVVRARYKLSLPSMNHGPKSFMWFSTTSDEDETQMGAKNEEKGPPTPEKDEFQTMKAGQIYVRRDIESVMTDL